MTYDRSTKSKSQGGSKRTMGTRIVTYGLDTPEVLVRIFAVGQDGEKIQPDKFNAKGVGPDENHLQFRYEWSNLSPDALLFRLTRFIEGKGFWTPLQLPPVQSDEMIVTVEALLNLFGLTLLSGLGFSRKWAKGARL